MDDVNIIDANYVFDLPNIGETVGNKIAIMATIDGIEMSVPLDPANRHYAEIQKQLQAGTLTIANAD